MSHQNKLASSASASSFFSSSHHTWSTYESINNEQELVRALLLEQGMLQLVEPSASGANSSTAGVASGGVEDVSPALMRTAHLVGQSFAKRSKFSLDEMEVQ